MSDCPRQPMPTRSPDQGAGHTRAVGRAQACAAPLGYNLVSTSHPLETLWKTVET